MASSPTSNSASVISADEAEAERLRGAISILELEIATLASELQIFEDDVRGFTNTYERRFGRLLADIEALDAEIAELIALKHRDDVSAQAAAREARSRADDTARRHQDV